VAGEKEGERTGRERKRKGRKETEGMGQTPLFPPKNKFLVTTALATAINGAPAKWTRAAVQDYVQLMNKTSQETV